jgi:hypothetical protein
MNGSYLATSIPHLGLALVHLDRTTLCSVSYPFCVSIELVPEPFLKPRILGDKFFDLINQTATHFPGRDEFMAVVIPIGQKDVSSPIALEVHNSCEWRRDWCRPSYTCRSCSATGSIRVIVRVFIVRVIAGILRVVARVRLSTRLSARVSTTGAPAAGRPRLARGLPRVTIPTGSVVLIAVVAAEQAVGTTAIGAIATGAIATGAIAIVVDKEFVFVVVQRCGQSGVALGGLFWLI